MGADEPVIHIDDSDVVKPDDYKFESLGIVRNGSESTSTKNVYKKGYQSVNTITFQAMEQGAALFGRAVFCMNCGYDDNKMFLKLDELGQGYVIRVARIYFSR